MNRAIGHGAIPILKIHPRGRHDELPEGRFQRPGVESQDVMRVTTPMKQSAVSTANSKAQTERAASHPGKAHFSPNGNDSSCKSKYHQDCSAFWMSRNSRIYSPFFCGRATFFVALVALSSATI